MTITWYGFSCFKIEEKTQAGEVSLVIDPYAAEDGHKLPRNLAADVLVSSHDHPRHRNFEAVSGISGAAPFIITGPGEYEVKDVFVTGVSTYHDLVEGKEKGANTMNYITVGDVHLLHLGDLKHALEEKHLEEFHNIDVLFVPVGGGDVLNAKQAVEVINQIEPRIIIPMHYRDGGIGNKFETADAFLKAMGAGKVEKLPKLKLVAKDLPQEEMKVIVLEMQ